MQKKTTEKAKRPSTPRVSKAKKELAREVLQRMRTHYGEVICTLDVRDDPWQLLVAAILAAQCTDARVNLVTPALFSRFPTPADFASAGPAEIEPYISSCGLFRNKAKGIYGAARTLLDEFGGVVPQSREELLRLPGVGRKIANLLLGECFGIQAVVVDTHCGRLSKHLGVTKETDPVRVEKDLVACVPEDSWADWGHYMVHHGREVCLARHPHCEVCFLQDICAQGRRYRKDSERKAKQKMGDC